MVAPTSNEDSLRLLVGIFDSKGCIREKLSTVVSDLGTLYFYLNFSYRKATFALIL
jgi:hypothetical protein